MSWQKRFRQTHKWVIGGLCLLMGACQSTAREDSHENGCEPAASISKYGVTPLQKQPIYEELVLPGEVVALPSETIPLLSLTDAVVEEVYVGLGEGVEVGKPLLALRSPQLARWQAQGDGLRSLIRAARIRVAALDSLFREGLVARNEVAQAQADLATLVAESLEVASNLRPYRYEGGRFLIQAPKAGTIIHLPARNGMPIQAGDTLLILSNLSQVRAHVYFYADQAGLIRPGLPVKLKPTGAPYNPIQTTVAGLYPTLDPVERTGTAYADLPNPDRTLYPGLYLNALITRLKADSAVFVPAKAVVFSSNTHYALVWRPSCTWEVRPLRVRHTLREGFFCNNLQPGDSIATENVLLLFQKLTQRL